MTDSELITNVKLTLWLGVFLQSSHSRRWWSSQIPQMYHSLLLPRKHLGDLQKQGRIHNTTWGLRIIWRWFGYHGQRCILMPHDFAALWHSIKNIITCKNIVRCGEICLTVTNWRLSVSLTCAREDGLVVFLREQWAGLDLSGTMVQVQCGSGGNPRPIVTLNTWAIQIGKNAIYKDANILQKQSKNINSCYCQSKLITEWIYHTYK